MTDTILVAKTDYYVNADGYAVPRQPIDIIITNND